VDFGIVKYLDGPAHLTEAGFIVGTPLYMSPEQALGSQSVDARSDVYGIGAVLFQLLTGAPPFEGTDSQEIVGRHISEPVPSDSLVRSGIPDWISGIVVRCMAKHPDDRFPTARALLESIRAARLGARPGGADPVSLLPRADETPTEALPTARRRQPARAWLVGLTAAALVGGVMLATSGREPGLGSESGALPAAAQERIPQSEGGVAPSRPALVVANRLTEPIALTVEDTSLMISPGDTGRVPLRFDEPLEAHWAMVQPATGERVLGGMVEGTIVAERVDGELRKVVDAGIGGEPRFTPTIVNRSSRALRVSVLAGEDSLPCECRVGAGDSLRLGYYRFSGRSAVRVTDARGWSARYGGLGTRRDSSSGAVRVPVVSSDLRPPPAPRAGREATRRRNDEARRNPLGSFLPVR
jgi:serine/threonine-protein kinase